MGIYSEIAELESRYFSDAWSEKTLTDTFEYEYNHLLLEKQQGRVAGYVIYSELQGEAELLRIAVDKSYRRRGYGHRLLTAMLEELRDFGAERVSLEVRAHNLEAIRLYRSLGFEDIYIRKNYYRDPEDDALIFQKLLDEPE